MRPTRVENSTFQIFYEQNKQYFLPVGIILTCILVFLFFLMPQIQDIFTLKDQRVQLEQRIARLKDNVNALQDINEDTTSSQLQIMSTALPPDKNFEAILQTIMSAAQTANVSLGDYSFDVGNLATESAQQSKLSLQLQVTINGNISDMQRFISELSKRVPIAEAQNVTIGSGQSSADTQANQTAAQINFYYRPFPDLTFDPQTPIRKLSDTDLQTIAKMQAWESAADVSPTPESTSSNQPTPVVQNVIAPSGANIPTPTPDSSANP